MTTIQMKRIHWRQRLGWSLGIIAVLLVGFIAGTIMGGAGNPRAFADDDPVATPETALIDARPGRDVAGSGDLIGFSHITDAGSQVISLVNTRKMWLAVYHVDPSGSIRLTSSREIGPDFTLQFNATEPLPDKIRRINGTPSSP